MNILTWLRKSVNLFSVLFAVALLMSDAAAFIPPSKAWILSFFGLAYIPLLFINIFFTVFWVVVRLRHAVFPFITILLSWNSFFNTFAFHLSSNTEKHIGDFRVMSYNVRNFDLYNWSANENTRSNMFKQIKKISPDVVCFQEFMSRDEGNYMNVKELTELGYKYYHFEKTLTLHRTEHWGIATFSKFPIVNRQRVEYKNETRNACIYSDIKVKGKIIRVYNAHLQSVFFGRNDYKFIDSLEQKKFSSISRAKNIMRKMKQAYEYRGKQAEDIAESISHSPYPVIVCADCNDTPSSYAYRTIRRNMQDVFTKKSWGVNHTYNRFLPILRIDYIFSDNTLIVKNYFSSYKKYSDHYPVITDLSFL